MPLKRYLLKFGYIGTYFRGVQKQHCKGIAIRPAETVQGLLEICLRKLRIKPSNIPTVTPSSRTDSGVHALCSTAHTDLDFSHYDISTEQITAGLNFVLRKGGFTNISVYDTQQVPNTFSARHHAINRTYIYRFAVLKKDFDVHKFKKITSVPLPILEQDRCFFILEPNLDLEIISRACQKFIGTKDFRSFMGSHNEPKGLVTERTIYNFELKPGKPLYPCPLSDNFTFYEIEVTGRSFLYRQVRRMVATLFAIGLKKLSIPEIDYLFDFPSKDSWNPDADVPSGCGLYLAAVRYNESDMILTQDNQIVNVSEFNLEGDEYDSDIADKKIIRENQS